MRFAASTLFISSLSTTKAFGPAARSLTNSGVAPRVGARKFTELNLFGFGKYEKFDKAAKVDGEITPKEVRALFELWNAALATGDSRIVANRYTKVGFSHALPIRHECLCAELMFRLHSARFFYRLYLINHVQISTQ